MDNSRIRWTKHEVQLVGEAVYNRLVANGYKKFDSIGLDKIVAVAAVVQASVLPEDRVRTIRTVAHVSRIVSWLEQHYDDAQTCVEDTAEETEEIRIESPGHVHGSEEAEAYVPERTMSADELFEAFASKVESRLFDRLYSAIAAKIVEDLLSGDKLEELISLRNSTRQAKPTEPIQQEKREKRLIVGVLGLLPIQEQTVKNAFPDIVFKCYNEFPCGKPPHVDYMIGMVGFMGHPTDAKAKKVYKENYLRNSNGVTSLITMIEQIFGKQRK